jgi:hypothetical protein
VAVWPKNPFFPLLTHPQECQKFQEIFSKYESDSLKC